jgi:CheY-like chemotaxis protein
MALAPEPAGRVNPKVLIVEDDEHLACAIGDALTGAGYEVISARDGREALAALQLGRPDVLLVDMFMPRMSGSELLGIVRSSPEWAEIPRLVMTGANDPMIGIRSDAAVIYKPLDWTPCWRSSQVTAIDRN